MPSWTPKDERQYEHIKDSTRERGVSEDKAEEIAARTVNKRRREEGRTPNRRTQGTGNPNRGLESRAFLEIIIAQSRVPVVVDAGLGAPSHAAAALEMGADAVLVNTAIAAIIFLAIVLSLVPHDMMYGPQAALIAESFTGRLRYSGSSLGYQLASIIAGGPAPLIATWLFGRYHTPYAIAAYIAVCAVISLIAAALMKDFTGKSIEGEYEA